MADYQYIPSSYNEQKLSELQFELLNQQAREGKYWDEFQLSQMGYRKVPNEGGLSADQRKNLEGQLSGIEDRIRQSEEQINKLGPGSVWARPFEHALEQLTTDARNLRSKLTAGDSGFRIEEIPYSELSPEQQRYKDISKYSQERTLAAFKGDLPVSPGLERSIQRGIRNKEIELERKHGANWRETSAGISQIGDVEQRAEGLREDVRTGEITQGYARYLQDLYGEQDYQRGIMSDIYGRGATTANLFNAPLNRESSFRLGIMDLATQAKLQSSANRAGIAAARYGMVGDIIGGAMGIGAAYAGRSGSGSSGKKKG